MGNLENEIKREIRITKIHKAILQTIYTAGVLSVALLAPNALKLLKPYIKEESSQKDRKYYINLSRKRLVDKGLINYNKNGFLELTPHGNKILHKIEMNNFIIKQPKKWDGKWRVLIFDIKENKRIIRDQIRHTLNQIGFIKLQNSVWVYPYECEDYITLLKADLGIGKEVLYMIVDKIENYNPLVKHFKLS